MFKQLIILVVLLSLSLTLSNLAYETKTDETKIDLKKVDVKKVDVKKVDVKLTAEINSFNQMMIKDHGFTEQELSLWFANVKPNQGILKTIKRPAEAALPWHKYRNIFIQQERIDLGVAFWKENFETLQRAEKTFGVPAEVIVGLIGVETKYGRIKGNIDVFESLYTLGFHFPRRTKFFRKELKEFLILSKEQQWTPGMIKGSYAGAMGYGQFMPSSYRMYAVDFDGDGKINLLTNVTDAIGSVANYIKVHKWHVGEAIIHKVEVTGDNYKKMLQKSMKPAKKISEFINAGVKITDPLANGKIDSEQLATLIELKQEKQKAYWLGRHNFYVISRYNPRTLYTMAVVQLTELIRKQYYSAPVEKQKKDTTK